MDPALILGADTECRKAFLATLGTPLHFPCSCRGAHVDELLTCNRIHNVLHNRSHFSESDKMGHFFLKICLFEPFQSISVFQWRLWKSTTVLQTPPREMNLSRTAYCHSVNSQADLNFKLTMSVDVSVNDWFCRVRESGRYRLYKICI